MNLKQSIGIVLLFWSGGGAGFGFEHQILILVFASTLLGLFGIHLLKKGFIDELKEAL